MAELFQTTGPNFNMHLKNVFEEGELDRAATIKDFLIVRTEGNRKVCRSIECYINELESDFDWAEKT
ncbi:MAG: hypothetical protein IPM59_01005 [Chloracidobacterium sp.]|nr:hypothetical protein [Chloracidobacterium sp.]